VGYPHRAPGGPQRRRVQRVRADGLSESWGLFAGVRNRSDRGPRRRRGCAWRNSATPRDAEGPVTPPIDWPDEEDCDIETRTPGPRLLMVSKSTYSSSEAGVRQSAATRVIRTGRTGSGASLRFGASTASHLVANVPAGPGGRRRPGDHPSAGGRRYWRHGDVSGACRAAASAPRVRRGYRTPSTTPVIRNRTWASCRPVACGHLRAR